MTELFGIQLETIFQGASGAIIAAVLIWWIRGWSDRRRAKNETLVIENGEAARLREEMMGLNQRALKDIDSLCKRLEAMDEKQRASDKQILEATKQLLEAATVQRQDRADMDSMIILIQLLIREVKRLDKNPENILIQHAEMVLASMIAGRPSIVPGKSPALDAAESAVVAARLTVTEARATVDEVNRAESGGK